MIGQISQPNIDLPNMCNPHKKIQHSLVAIVPHLVVICPPERDLTQDLMWSHQSISAHLIHFKRFSPRSLPLIVQAHREP